MDFQVDKTFNDKTGKEYSGILHLTISAAESMDHRNGVLPFEEQELLLNRYMELIHQNIDIFNDPDHEVKFDHDPTIDEMRLKLGSIGNGILGNYIVTRAYTTIENGTPVARVSLKLLDQKVHEKISKLRGVSIAGMSYVLRRGNAKD